MTKFVNQGEFIELEILIAEFIRQLDEEVANDILAPAEIISCGWWHHSPKSLNGALYVRPNGIIDEQQIAAIFSIELNQPNLATFDIYIDWSDGTIISQILEEQYPYSSPSDLAKDISKIINPLGEQVLHELVRILSLHPPPRYFDW